MQSFLFNRSRSYEPVGRGLYQWTSVAESYPPEDRRDGSSRRSALRHLKTAARLARLRVKDT